MRTKQRTQCSQLLTYLNLSSSVALNPPAYPSRNRFVNVSFSEDFYLHLNLSEVKTGFKQGIKEASILILQFMF